MKSLTELLGFRLHHTERAYSTLYEQLEALAAKDPNGELWVLLVQHDVWRDQNGFPTRFQYRREQ